MLAEILSNSGNITVENILEMPVDLVFALNFFYTIKEVSSNLPEEYQPKEWQWLFDDEIQKKIEKYKQSLKLDKKERVGEIKEETKNPLGEILKHKLMRED